MIKEFTEDFQFYLGEQWPKGIKAEMEKEGRPVLSLNYIKKNIDTIHGLQRQNKVDIKYRPEEGGDEDIAEVMTRIAKWVRNPQQKEELTAKKDSTICGLGWVYAGMDYTRNKEGEVSIVKLSPFDVGWDPRSNRLDHSDANYVHIHKLIHRDRLIEEHPEFEDELSIMVGRSESNGIFKDPLVASDQGDYLKVVELWYKELEKVEVIIDASDTALQIKWNKGETKRIRDDLEKEGVDIKSMTDKQLLEMFLEQNPNFEKITRKELIIYRAIVVEDQLVLEDEIYTDTTCFPLVPYHAFYESSYSDHDIKIHGMVRPLKDPQKEKNKRRQQFQEIINSVPTSGFVAEEGSITDVNDYRRGAGGGRMLYYRPGRPMPIPIQPPQVPSAFMTLEQMSEQDMYRISMNPDSLGMLSDPGAAGVAVQLRQKQGIAAFQEMFDNHGEGTKLLGKILAQLIANKFSIEKVKRILGEDGVFADRRKKLKEQAEQVKQQMQAGMFAPENPEKQQQMQQGDQVMKQLEGQERLLNEEEERFWIRFKNLSKTMRYDVFIDEIANSPTSRMATLSQLKEMQQYGKEIPMEIYIEFSDMDLSIKTKYLALEQQKQAQQQQAVQLQQQQFQQEQQSTNDQMVLENKKLEEEVMQNRREHELEMAKIKLSMEKIEADISKTESEIEEDSELVINSS